MVGMPPYFSYSVGAVVVVIVVFVRA